LLRSSGRYFLLLNKKTDNGGQDCLWDPVPVFLNKEEDFMKSYIGLIGAGVMGKSLSINISRNGYSISIYDVQAEKVEQFIQNKAKGNPLISGFGNFDDFMDSLEEPKKVLLLVPAGDPVESVVTQLSAVMKSGDMIIDCGNSYYKDTIRREKWMKKKGILYFGVGISGGEKGALEGPSIMPGGDKESYDKYLADLLQKISAHTVDHVPCCDYIGSDGAGHYVKMVHNGIEYGDIQIICEAYFLMKNLLSMNNAQIADVFDKWNRGKLNSYLTEITSIILRKKDNETGNDLVDMILDEAGQKGTGKWASMEALDMGVPAPTICESVVARCLSAIKEQRIKASKIFITHKPENKTLDKEEWISKLEDAIYAAKIISYAQGFALMKEASEEHHWDLHYGSIALLWREGCIIRAQFLEKIKQAYDHHPDLENLMMEEPFSEDLEKAEKGFREIVSCAVQNGIYIPCLSSSLQYFDGYRTEVLPANLLQAERDYFGAHTYHRIDKPITESFHTKWEE
jgi:6-phosphogluconate dehydrogenase